MLQYHVAIVEDEQEAAARLEECLARYGREEGMEFSITHFENAQKFLRTNTSGKDIVFMDIRMPGMDGMEAARALREKNQSAVLVFVTSMVQYAVKGYEVDAADFIVKPVRYSAFCMKMKRILSNVSRQDSSILLNMEGVSRVVSVSDIYYVEVQSHKLIYHTRQGVFTVRGKLSTAQSQLPERMFFRVSISFLINLRYVEQIAGDDVFIGTQCIRISRGRKKPLMTALTAYLGDI